MAISVFPAATAAVASTLNVSTFTAASANTLYRGSVSLDPALYTITCVNTTIANIEFYSSQNARIASAVTASGTVSVNIPSSVSSIRAWTNTGSDVVITITKVSFPVSNSAISGTLDIVTTTSTYTGTSTSGYAYAVVVGGGAGGARGSTDNSWGGGGGGAGGVVGKYVQLTGSMAVVIGAAGIAGVFGGNPWNGGDGGTTTFAGISAYGGGGSPFGPRNAGGGGSGAGGDIVATGGAGGAGAAAQNSIFTSNPGVITSTVYPFITPLVTTGGGGGGWSSGGGSAGGVGAIGTGGTGGTNSGVVGGTGTGYGAGGGGGASGAQGGAGSQGAVYVFKF
jgi:hypothetical protein